MGIQVDWDGVGEVDEFEPLPSGDYLCEVEKVDDTDKTQYGDDMWRLQFTVVDGEYEGRKLFDNLVFSSKAMKRVKLICSRLGVKTEGSSELRPDDLIGKQVWVTAEQSEYEGKRSNKIPFAGYQKIADGAPRKQAGSKQTERTRAPVEDDVPF